MFIPKNPQIVTLILQFVVEANSLATVLSVNRGHTKVKV